MIDVEKLRALHEAATPGPWEVSLAKGSVRAQRAYEDGSSISTRVAATHDGNAKRRDADYALIAHLRNSVPAIIALAEREKQMREALEAFTAGDIDVSGKALIYRDAREVLALGHAALGEDATHDR